MISIDTWSSELRYWNESIEWEFRHKVQDRKSGKEEKGTRCNLVISFKILISKFASIQLNSKAFRVSKIIFPNFLKIQKKCIDAWYLYFSLAIFIRAKKKIREKEKEKEKKIAKSYIACQKHVHVKRKFPLLNTPCSPPVPFSRSNSYDEKSRTGHIFSSKKLYKVKTESLNDKEFVGNNRAHDYTVIFRYAPNHSSTSPFPFLSFSLSSFPLFFYSPVAFNASALNFRSNVKTREYFSNFDELLTIYN